MVVPIAIPETMPLFTVAMDGSVVVHTTGSVQVEGVTDTLSITVLPGAILTEVLFNEMPVAEDMTVIVQEAVLFPALAVIVAEPIALAVTTPSDTEATVASVVLQVTVLSVAFVGLTVAVRDKLWPVSRTAELLFNVIDKTSIYLSS